MEGLNRSDGGPGSGDSFKHNAFMVEWVGVVVSGEGDDYKMYPEKVKLK